MNNGKCIDGVQNYTCNCTSLLEDSVWNFYTGRNCAESEGGWVIPSHDLFYIALYSFVSTEVDNRVAPSLTTSPTSQNVDLNDRVTLSCSATGNPTPNIQWYKEGIAIKSPQAFGSEFVITETTPKQRGFYRCVAFSSYGPPARSDEVSILIKGENILILN